jgi:V/A-type H+-transporting ATPase subunit C
VFGPEPVFSYGLAKRRELSLVRLLGVGKINQIPTPILKERISETYV